MSDKMRWRYGDTNPVVAAIDPDTVIEIGDLVWQDIDDAKPASSQPEEGSNLANQAAFAEKFLGVAMQRSRNADCDPIRVATTGVFEFDCSIGSFELGDLIGPIVKNADGTKLFNQRVTKVAHSRYAIGRVAKREPLHPGSVLVDVRSTVMTGGIEATSRSGV